MKAIVLTRSGSPDRLILTDVAKPTPQSTEFLLQIHVATVTRGDVVMRRMPRMMARFIAEMPRSIPGYEFAGVVEATGESSSRFDVGDRVFGVTSGLTQGAYAEYLCIPQDGLLTHIPNEVGYAEAAPVPIGAMTALHFLRQAGPLSGRRLLLNGASGSVGSFAVQIAKHFGAHVTGVCSTANMQLVSELGAEEVIDYTRQDFKEGDRPYDVIFDAAGKTTARQSAAVLAEGGTFVTTRGRRHERVDDLHAVRDLLAAGVIKAVVDRSYELAQISQAHRYVEGGHKRGNVIVTVGA